MERVKIQKDFDTGREAMMMVCRDFPTYIPWLQAEAVSGSRLLLRCSRKYYIGYPYIANSAYNVRAERTKLRIAVAAVLQERAWIPQDLTVLFVSRRNGRPFHGVAEWRALQENMGYYRVEEVFGNLSNI